MWASRVWEKACVEFPFEGVAAADFSVSVLFSKKRAVSIDF